MSATAGVVAILVFSIFFAALFLELLEAVPKRYRIPFSVVLFLFGVALGAINRAELFECQVNDHEEEPVGGEPELEGGEAPPPDPGTQTRRYGLGCFLGVGADQLAKISPDIMLLILLPPVLFLSTFEVTWHTLRRTLPQSLVLAFPGVAVSVALLGVYVRFGLISDQNATEWSWGQSFLLASILAATDPVAVVAALKELGAPDKLTTIIEGESLLNDGSAFVVFLIFKDIVVRASENLPPPSAGAAVGDFFQLALGGPLFGILMGFIAHYWGKTVYNSRTIETTITLVGAYITFWLAEEILEVSAVLAVVTYGFYYAYRGKFAISPEVEESVENFWTLISWYAESLIFVIAGLITYDAVFTTALVSDGLLWANLAIMYIVMQAVRFAMVLIAFPVLSRMGGNLNWKEGVVIGYGGLRGAVSLTLALIVELEVPNRDYGDRVLFYVAGCVALTLLVNGMTADVVYDALKMVEPSKATIDLFDQALECMDDDLDLVYARLQSHWFYKTARWERLEYVIPKFHRVEFSGQKVKFSWPQISWLFDGVPAKKKAALDQRNREEREENAEKEKAKRDRPRNMERKRSFELPKFLRMNSMTSDRSSRDPEKGENADALSSHSQQRMLTYSEGRPRVSTERRNSLVRRRNSIVMSPLSTETPTSPYHRRLHHLTMEGNLKNTLFHIDMDYDAEDEAEAARQLELAKTKTGIYDYSNTANGALKETDEQEEGNKDDEQKKEPGAQGEIKKRFLTALATEEAREVARPRPSVEGVMSIRSGRARPSVERMSSILPAVLGTGEEERYRVLLNAVKARYYKQYHAGFLHDTAMAYLIHSIDATADEEREKAAKEKNERHNRHEAVYKKVANKVLGHDVNRPLHASDVGIDFTNPHKVDLELEVLISGMTIPAFLKKSSKVPVLGWLFNGILYQRLHEQCEALLGFINAHQAILQECDEEIEEITEIAGLDKLRNEIEVNIKKAKKEIRCLFDEYPKEIRSVQTVLATSIILRIQRDKLKHLAEEGVLEVSASCELASGVDAMIGSLKDFYVCVKS